MYVLDTASAAYVHDKTLARCNGATPVLLFSGVTFMIGAGCPVRPGRELLPAHLNTCFPQT